MGLRGPVRAVLLGVVACSAAGCYAAGTLAHLAFGPPAVDAEYEPQKRPTLVLVEDFQDPDAPAADGDVVARAVGERLHDHADLDVVDPDKLVPLRTEQAGAFHNMSIPAVGRTVGADQVVYINLVENETSADPTGAAIHATATARVRIVDAKTGTVLWPAGQPRGKELTAKMEYDRADSAQGEGMRGEMLSQLSDSIAKLFYTWKPETEKESNDAGS